MPSETKRPEVCEHGHYVWDSGATRCPHGCDFRAPTTPERSAEQGEQAARFRALVLKAAEELGRYGLSSSTDATASLASLIANASRLGSVVDAARADAAQSALATLQAAATDWRKFLVDSLDRVPVLRGYTDEQKFGARACLVVLMRAWDHEPAFRALTDAPTPPTQETPHD